MDDGKKIRVLVVEDTPFYREILSRMLRDLGVEVVSARDGERALEKIKNEKNISAVITDWMMPNMDGIAFVKHIRNIPGMEKTPILMVTGHDTSQAKIAQAAGVNEFLHKPVSLKELVQKFNMIGIAVSPKKI